MTRKIEQALVAAIREGRHFSSGNTRYNHTVGGVFLHENPIARVSLDGQGWEFSLAGWNTPTTRSRINALLDAFSPGRRVFTRNGTPFVSSNGQTASLHSTEWF